MRIRQYLTWPVVVAGVVLTVAPLAFVIGGAVDLLFSCVGADERERRQAALVRRHVLPDLQGLPVREVFGASDCESGEPAYGFVEFAPSVSARQILQKFHAPHWTAVRRLYPDYEFVRRYQGWKISVTVDDERDRDPVDGTLEIAVRFQPV